jgi:hypothetical protein
MTSPQLIDPVQKLANTYRGGAVTDSPASPAPAAPAAVSGAPRDPVLALASTYADGAAADALRASAERAAPPASDPVQKLADTYRDDELAAGEEKSAAERPGEVQPGDAPQAAPAKFTAPEGVHLDATVIDAYGKLAQELKLPHDTAQRLVNEIAPVMARRQLEVVAAARADWLAKSKADSEIGLADFDDSRAAADRLLRVVGTVELRQLLRESGLIDHPELLRFFVRVAQELRHL